MASIQKRPGPRYRVQVRRAGRYHSATFATADQARRWARRVEYAIDEDLRFARPLAPGVTVGDLCQRYLREVLPAKSLGTQAHQRAHLAWWQEALGAVLLAQLRPAQLAACRDQLAHRLGPGTVGQYLATLRHALRLARMEWGWLEQDPLAAVRWPPVPRGRVRYLSDDERQRLLEACQASKNRLLSPAVVLALSTGARKMELLCVEWSDIDWMHRQLVLRHTKNGETRAVPLVGKAFEAVVALSQVRRIDTPLIFPRRDGEAPIDLRHAWYGALERAGVQDFRWHDLRHSCASYLAMQNVSQRLIAEVLGHKSLSMSFRYSHLAPQHTRSVLEQMDRAMFGP
jgi:integrase